MNKAKLILAVPLLLLMAFSAGCGMKKLSSTEIGAVYKKLPGKLGGFKKVVEPGDFIMWFPVTTEIYIIDTLQMSSRYAGSPQSPKADAEDYALNTRAFDGNEVDLETTIRYHIMGEIIRKDPEAFLSIVKPDKKFIKDLTKAFSRSKIRMSFGEIRTNEFYNNDKRYGKVAQSQEVLDKSLNPYAIKVDDVILDGHSFQGEYQNVINQARTMEQKAQEQKNAIETIKSNKKKEIQEEIGRVNQAIAEADGELEQARLRGDAYYTAKEKEAERIMIEGKNRVAAIQKNIEALQKQGGEDLVRLDVAEALIKSKAVFYIIPGQGAGSGSLNVAKTDYNQLLEQLGKLGIAGETPAQQDTK